MVMGTAHYIAPEQALGHPAEPASDVYSLAVCGYECLAGHRPFLSENAVTVAMMHIRDAPPPLPPDVPPAARAVIEATLVKDPRQRYNSGGEFANAVAAVRSGLPLPTPRGLVSAAYAATPPPVTQPPVPQPAQQVPPSGPMSPVPPMTALGPPSRPVMRPAVPVRHRKRSQWGWWVLLAAIIIAVLVAGVVVLAKVFGGPDPAPVRSNGEQQTTQPVPGGLPNQAGTPLPSAYPAATTSVTDPDGPQGIMTPPWTEWNGTQR
jgi:serine/threonine-protein kinase